LGVTATVWLGQAVGAENVEGSQAVQVFVFEICRAVLVDHPRAHVVDADVGAGADAACRERLED